MLAVGLPALLGFPVAWVMQGTDLAGPNGQALLPLGLFIGAALSVTAFPVMAHILMERGEMNSSLGALSVACAGLISFFMFIYIAFASSTAQKQGLDIFITRLVLIAIFSLASVLMVRPLLRFWLSRLKREETLTGDAMALIFGGLTLWALLAHLLGIHALIGSFIWGFLLPEEPWLQRGVTQRVRDLATTLFLPVFFALAGFSTDLKLLRPELLPALLLFVSVAVASKFVSALPARQMGLGWGDVFKLGALFNMRGLLVLAVGLIGLDFQIITPAAFTVIVVTALVTNLMTLPVFRLIEQRGQKSSPRGVIKTQSSRPEP
jgi:Kef-type K+ transport system membrane component KefB